MNNKYVKYSFLILLAIYSFFFLFGQNIYRYSLTEKKDLTIEQIKKFEDDVKAGVEIDVNDYVVKEKNYNNKLTEANGSISNLINYGFRKLFELIFKSIDV